MTFANISRSDLSKEAEKSAVLKLARSEGQVEISFKEAAGKSALKHLYQSGCGRVRFPAVDHAEIPEAILINTAGGLTGGDSMRFDVTVEKMLN